MLDISQISAWATANPILSGGIGTVAFSSLLYVARSIPHAILDAATRTLSTNLSVNTRNRQYDEVAILLGQKSLRALMRNYTPSKPEDDNRSSGYARRRLGKKDPMNLVPGYGRGWGLYDGTLMVFNRYMLETKGDEINEQLDIRFLTRDVAKVSRFLDEAVSLEDLGQIKVRLSDHGCFGSTIRKPKRELSTIFASAAVKDRLTAAMSAFIDGEERYKRQGMPYKFCAVLSGPPGTGKTSLVHALASEFDLGINYVSALAAIDDLVMECGIDDLLVIEDIDALAPDLSREDDEDGKPIAKGTPTSTLHKLLNALDGFCTPHGLKVVMTTNHPEKLDPALLRPGRTDLMLEVGPLSGEDLKAMFEAFYGPGSGQMLDGLTIAPHTGSRLQQIFVTHSAEQARDALVAA